MAEQERVRTAGVGDDLALPLAVGALFVVLLVLGALLG